MQGWIGRGEADGELLDGGRRVEITGSDAYLEPAVIAGLDAGHPLHTEEVFGPVAQLHRVADIEEAVELANATRFGLGANAWTNDEAEREVFIRDIAAGATFINGMTASFPALPFGGVKASGHGRELAAHGMREFTNLKTVWVGEGGPGTTATKTE